METSEMTVWPVKFSAAGLNFNNMQQQHTAVTMEWFSAEFDEDILCRFVFEKQATITSFEMQMKKDTLEKKKKTCSTGLAFQKYESILLSSVEFLCSYCKITPCVVPSFTPVNVMFVPFKLTLKLQRPSQRCQCYHNHNYYGGVSAYITGTVTFKLKPACRFPSFLSKLHEGFMSDVKLRVGGTVLLKGHRCVLGASSPKFQAIFEKGNRSSKDCIVDILEFNVKVVQQMLRFVYGIELNKLDANTLVDLLKLATQYEFPELKSFSESLLCRDTSLDPLHLLTVADNNGADKLVEAVMDRIAMPGNRGKILKEKSLEKLATSNPGTFVKLLMKLGA